MRTDFWLTALLAAVIFALPACAQVGPDDLLPVEEAFALSASAEGDMIVLDWQIADGYYLYRHAFEFEELTERLKLGEARIPDGIPDHDDFFGDIESYRDSVRIMLPVLAAPEDGRARLRVRSQGCADLGVCYPPHRQEVSVQVDPPAVASPVDGLDRLLGRNGGGGLIAEGDADPLPAEQAFGFEAIAVDPATLLVRFTARPDYYLYRDQFVFVVLDDDIEVARASLPPAEPIFDEFFGDTFVYYQEVEIPIHLSRPSGSATTVQLQADFQGCLTDGICYPPMTRVLNVDLPAAPEAIRPAAVEQTEAPAAAVVAVAEQDRLAGALSRNPMLALSLFFVAGLLLAFTPCVFPMVPILSGLIAGEGDRLTTFRAFRLSLVYVLAMALVYTLFGVVAGLFGQNLQALFQHPAVLGGFAALFVLLSLAMFGFYELQLPSSWQTRLNQLSNRAEGGTLIGAAVMGALSALIVGPCVAPALMGALIYIGQTGDAVLGGSALFAMAIGMGVPLVVWGTSAGKLLPRAGGWMNAVKAVFGVGLLALAIWMLERVVPPAVVMLMWGALLIACGVYLGALTRLDASVSGWRKLWQALGVILLVLGVFQLIGAASGARDWMRPLSGLAGSGVSAPATVDFTPVRSVAELDAALAAAGSQPVFLDFYADWCVDCRRMERRTFPDPDVAGRLAGFVNLKVDVTAYNEDDRQLLERFGLIGPPAYLFFIEEQELGALRQYGFVSPGEFARLLDRVGR